ncbi:uncharacterized protein TrAFT101_007097 [Trichoderma asperellum]|uniref:uncharacterized protein n=1 Tax=Trichoderma asperellum TaxID=101201 RepID=UPI00331DDABD|nr:hypothetical protein TrAFT101_007097 [Trichoderma asperellum]
MATIKATYTLKKSATQSTNAIWLLFTGTSNKYNVRRPTLRERNIGSWESIWHSEYDPKKDQNVLRGGATTRGIFSKELMEEHPSDGWKKVQDYERLNI